MSGGMLGSLALAAVFTLGCFGIHSARRHPDAVTIGLFLLLGLLASLYVGRHVGPDAHHPTWQHEALYRESAPTSHPTM
ncbi:hypothetical protein SAMN02799627_00078 [Methylobacterium sp. 13MFTsu3.1M2]|jgi:hypothetical protein|nr:hypothetical protein SAMN02799636_00681 [Methylobacterium sp. 275MFSha3.1]SFD29607.1 hypothetical protein SAMN02799627_00078 [Methylobacterium sp. 13MFTsu3.1M2]